MAPCGGSYPRCARRVWRHGGAAAPLRRRRAITAQRAASMAAASANTGTLARIRMAARKANASTMK